jgi:hypothetical protein
MEKPLSEQLVDSILDGSKESFMAAFNAALAAKVTDALEVKKVEIASTLMGSPAPTEELAVEEEVDLEESKKEMKDDEEEDDEEEMDDEEESDDEEDEKDMKEEAKGKVAVTPKEKALAAHHGDKSRITYGDVVKARIKSAKNEEVEQIDEVTPPGREKQVKALKGKVRNPYAVAWASYNKSKKNK